jgi:hypothetical protein
MIMSGLTLTANTGIDELEGGIPYFLSNPRLFQIEIIPEYIYSLKETILIPFNKPAEYWLMGYDTMIQRRITH